MYITYCAKNAVIIIVRILRTAVVSTCAADDGGGFDDAGQYYGLVMTYNPASSTADAPAADFQRKSTVVRVSVSY